MTGDAYVQSVIEHLPRGLDLRHQIEMELRSHIAERTGQGQPIDEILRQLGDPATLAESYLSAVPLQAAGLLPRFVAKVIDVVIVMSAAVAVACVLWFTLPGDAKYFVPAVGVFFATLAFVGYTIFAEYRSGRTLGKRVMGIQVVTEAGARISLGQSVLRQVPVFGLFVIDALFAVFTERRQRAFELLTKTRAVML